MANFSATTSGPSSNRVLWGAIMLFICMLAPKESQSGNIDIYNKCHVLKSGRVVATSFNTYIYNGEYYEHPSFFTTRYVARVDIVNGKYYKSPEDGFKSRTPSGQATREGKIVKPGVGVSGYYAGGTIYNSQKQKVGEYRGFSARICAAVAAYKLL